MPVTQAEVLQVAALARLEIDASAIDDVTNRFSRILDMVDDLNAVDTGEVEPMANPHDAVQRLRPDVVTTGDEREALLANAPEASDGYFLVPRVID
jgi:aspartyl-tRNA(Asn)/glutamyl-tRNA(Gln) amidotransferase subunit C